MSQNKNEIKISRKNMAITVFNWMGIISLGIFCFLYSVRVADFAECGIKLKQLGFPIFVGEILLVICIILSGIKWITKKVEFRPAHFLFLFFINFILIKALLGYGEFGPLAFRNAALFYYSIFFVLGYNFYDRKIFDKEILRLLTCIFLIFLVFIKIPTVYFLYTYYILIAVLSFSFSNRVLRYIGLGVALYFFLTSNLFNQTKGILISLWVTLTFLVFTLYAVMAEKNKNKKLKSTVFFVPIIALLLIFNFLVKEKTKERIILWGNVKNVINEFQIHNETLKLAKVLYNKKSFETGLYEKNIYTTQQETPPIEKEPLQRTGRQDIYNILWRMFVWRDMLKEVYSDKKILGEDFGKPFRSVSLESLNQLKNTGWHIGYPVGWIEPHNSYIHILYRTGIIGLLFIMVVWGLFIKLTLNFIGKQDLNGILLSSALLYWLILANFIVFLELPYFAIPFWTLFGVSLSYGYSK